MPLPTSVTTQTRTHQRTRTTPASAGLPDPRPITDYSVEYAEVAGRSRLVVTLDAPCIVREPMWSAIDVSDGSAVGPALGKPQSPTVIIFEFETVISRSACLLDVPSQDMQVQNYFGGFVRSGGKWFRSPA